MLDLYHHGGTGNQFHRVFNSASSNPFELSNLATDIEYAGTIVNYTFDANGNMLTEGAGRSFEWDFADQMRGFSEGTTTAAYLYDAGGNRVKKVVRKSASVKEVTVYIDGGFEYLYTLDGSNTVDDEYNEIHVMDGRSRVARIKVEDGIADEVKYNLDDHLGNASFTLDEAGSLINREEYFPFGETSFGSYLIKRYRYNGKERDEESGLYYYGARYYACWTCRFVSLDPLAGSMPDSSPYCYAANNPVVLVDVDGLAPGGVDEPSQPESGKGDGGNQGPQAPSVPGSSEGQQKTTPYVHNVEWIQGNTSLVYEKQVTDHVEWVWHAGTKEYLFQDERWMQKTEYQQYVFEKVLDKSTFLRRNPIGGNIYETPKSDQLGFTTGHKGGAFFPAYDAAVAAVKSMGVVPSQGLEDRSIDMVFMIEGGIGIVAIIRQGTKWGASKLISNGDEFVNLFDDAGKALGPGRNSPSTILGSDPATLSNAQRMVSESGIHQVLIHGTPDGFIVNGTKISPKELARLMLKEGFQPGTTVRLISCYSGVWGDGAAYQLSRYLKSPVIAPTNKITILRGGDYLILDNGYFKLFFNTTTSIVK